MAKALLLGLHTHGAMVVTILRKALISQCCPEFLMAFKSDSIHMD